ncbi:hypothetical protein H257_06728 [Aphanomyces astaci]|uniref:Myb-like domain-containing protein n=1 Tax=Aphanomyces astaci TaxID=112090 RepID=W4GL88_APHAT|nr:hypothetical protein H257_06728 [Aphanomyces astaci]ETV80455.1 hypothetical protein H257_06728 [Aphanomyces astaci]|eukprot:XP_009830379.1 hypothetical protein H257_06728 [Aphanomyces astaci]
MPRSRSHSPTIAQSKKRRNWSWEEDKVLLIQAATDKPFAAEKGQLTNPWQALADTLLACDHFTRVVDGRKKHILLDDIVALLDDVKEITSQKTSNSVVEKEKAEQGALIVWDMAIRTMKRPNDNDGDEQKKKPALDNRRNSLAAAIEVESERELVVRECNDGKVADQEYSLSHR